MTRQRPQLFPSLDLLVRHAKVILPKPRETWRLVKDPVHGTINGLDTFNGFSVATNGIMVLLQDEVGSFCFGHLQWFIPSEDEQNVELSDLWETSSPLKPKKVNKLLAMAEYL